MSLGIRDIIQNTLRMRTTGTVHGLRKSDLGCLLLDRIWLTSVLRGRKIGYFSSVPQARGTDRTSENYSSDTQILFSDKIQYSVVKKTIFCLFIPVPRFLQLY